jgi:hypothetical protein
VAGSKWVTSRKSQVAGKRKSAEPISLVAGGWWLGERICSWRDEKFFAHQPRATGIVRQDSWDRIGGTGLVGQDWWDRPPCLSFVILGQAIMSGTEA